jgi:hypothetical protein
MSAAIWSRNLALAHACPRCGARTRAGMPCRGQAMRCGVRVFNAAYARARERDGVPLRVICRSPGMPSRRTVYNWRGDACETIAAAGD